MEPLALTITIVLLALVMVVIYMIVDCCSGHYSSTSNYSGSIDESSISSSDKSSLPTAIVIDKDTKPSEGIANPVADVMAHIHQGSKSLHARGLCNVGFGAWGTVTSPTGRPACKNTWTPVSGGPFDSCQCEDNGGLH